MSRAAGHAYPWDVLGDPGFAGRVGELGIATVVLAAAYHSVRAATPLHPVHQLVEARHAALYRPVRPVAWRGRRLAPASPEWLSEPDPFGTAAHQLAAAGLRVSAWVVLTHSTRLGSAHPDLAVVNCFGEPYRYALCPSHAEVRDYAALLAVEAVRDTPVAEVSLEACGQLGVAHAGHHDKTAGAWSDAASRLLSICCCRGCRSAWAERGLPPAQVVTRLREAVRAELAGTGGTGVDEDALSALLAVRHRAADALRSQVVAAVREAAPGIRVVLHADPDPWATGPLPGLTAAAPKQVDGLLVPCWPTTADRAELVAAAAATGLPVDAYLTVLPPARTHRLVAHARRLRAAGAGRLSLYHLGLAPGPRQRWLAALAAV